MSEAPIRIVHCIGSMRVGGAEGQLAELIARLPRERFRQSLVLIRSTGGALEERVRAAGCEIFDLGLAMRFRAMDPRAAWAFGRALLRYRRFLRERRPDLVHAQLDWANILSVAAGRLAGVGVVATSRLGLNRDPDARGLRQKLENAANRRASAVLVNSEAVRREVTAHEGVAPERARLIYNGVALERFDGRGREAARRELGLGPKDLALIAVANLHPYKGHADLLRAAARLAVGRPGLRLLLPGRDQGEGPRLRRMIAELGLEGRASLLGERADVPALLAASDVYAHPSHEEGFSNAILEAMAARLPSVVTRVGGNAEAVRDGIEGFLAPPRDPDALAAALAPLLDDAALRARMGAAARDRVEREFSMERMVDEFARWYAELAPRNRPPGR